MADECKLHGYEFGKFEELYPIPDFFFSIFCVHFGNKISRMGSKCVK